MAIRAGWAAVSVWALALALSVASATAESVAEFYRGKSIRMLIGSAAGAGYDLTGRLLANHLERHIPGNPGVVVENMPGASGLSMTNYLYNIAAKDGTVIGMPPSGIVHEPRLHVLSREGGNASFDIFRFGWIGTPVQDPQVLWVYDTAPVRAFDDLRTTKITMGSTSSGADNYTLPIIVNQLFGAKMEIIRGYKGQGDIFLAAERGEIQGNATGLPNLKVAKADWMAAGKVRILLQFGSERLQSLASAPTAAELAATQEDREMLLFYALKFNMARPLAAPPGAPSDRVEALQAAFDVTMKDPQFLAEARRLGFDIDPLSGKEMANRLRAVAAAPEAMIDRLKKLIDP